MCGLGFPDPEVEQGGKRGFCILCHCLLRKTPQVNFPKKQTPRTSPQSVLGTHPTLLSLPVPDQDSREGGDGFIQHAAELICPVHEAVIH